MRNIFEVLAILKKEFIEEMNCGEEIDSAEENAMCSLTIEECEEYSEAIAQAFIALETLLEKNTLKI